jgi:Flp pilus assembly protein TadD
MSPMRTLRITLGLRAAALALPVLLGACTTLTGSDADVVATAKPQIRQTPPADEIKDDLGLGKMHFRKANYGLAEMHFRRAVEATPGLAEGWIGLAASYDQLKCWDLADRAYGQALRLTGPTPEFLNNRGYSYLLRGDVRRASQDLSTAAAKDPENERIQNNLRALDERVRRKV